MLQFINFVNCNTFIGPYTPEVYLEYCVYIKNIFAVLN